MHFAELRYSELLEQQKLVTIYQSMHYLQPLREENTIKLKYQILLYQRNNKSIKCMYIIQIKFKNIL